MHKILFLLATLTLISCGKSGGGDSTGPGGIGFIPKNDPCADNGICENFVEIRSVEDARRR